MRKTISTAICLALLALFTASHCVKSYPDDPLLVLATPGDKFTITLAVSGATGSFTVVNNGETFTIPGAGNHPLNKEYASGTAYSLSIGTPPTGQTCTISGASGILTASVSNVTVTCTSVAINSITQDRTYISANAGAYNSVQISFVSAYAGTYIIKSGADCATGTPYPDASATGILTNGGTSVVTLNATTGGTPLISGSNTYLICGYETGPTLRDEIARTVTVDNAAPTISPSQAPGNLTAATSISLTCNDSPSGCNGMAVVSQSVAAPSAPPNPTDPDIAIDGTGATPAPYGGAISAPDLQVTTIEAIAVDLAGNKSAVQIFNYTVDSSFSNISNEAVTNAFVSNVGTKTTTVISWDSDRSNRPYSLRINSTNCTDGTVIDTGTTGAGPGQTSAAIAATAFAPGTDTAYTVRICEENYVGQYDLGKTITVTRDETAPVITDVTGNGTYVKHNDPIVYRFSETVDTGATVIAGGDIENEDDGGAYFTSTNPDDELRISPAIGFHTTGMMIWSPGLNRALDLTVADRAGNSASVSHTYIMRDGTVQPYFTNAANWNYYIKNDGTTGLTASDTSCDGSENAFYFGCLHGGQVRKIMVLDKINDCTGVSGTDAQGWMNWYCVPQGAGLPVLLVSGNLQVGKSLKDLIDFGTPAWNTNSVTIAGTNVPNAPATAWWNNAVTNIPVGGGSLATAGGIYVQSANSTLTGTLDIAADNVVIAMDTGVLLRASGADPMVDNNGKNFLWIEGNFDGNGPGMVTTSGIRIVGPSYYHRLNNVRVWNVDGSANTGNIHLTDVSDSILTGVRGANSMNGNGLVIEDSGSNSTARNMVVNSTFYNNINSGIRIVANGMVDDLIVMNSFVASNEGDGIFVNSGGGGLRTSMFVNMTVVNNGADSFDFGSTADNKGLSLINVIAANAADTGIKFANGSSSNQVIDSAVALHGVAQIDMDSGAQTYFSGSMLIFSSVIADDCVNFGAGTGINDAACNPEGTSDHSVLLFNDADPISGNGVGFMGQAGIITGYSLTLNWVGFAAPYEFWGRNGNLLTPGGVRGRCNTSGLPLDRRCDEWDLALSSTSNDLLNGLTCPTGNDTITHTWTTATPGSITFLRHAIEDGTDGISDLPLCFGNEGCIYTPNFGAYQGHGALTASGCTGIGTGTTLENINFQQFSNNGF